jgi:hypothetical protein
MFYLEITMFHIKKTMIYLKISDIKKLENGYENNMKNI